MQIKKNTDHAIMHVARGAKPLATVPYETGEEITRNFTKREIKSILNGAERHFNKLLQAMHSRAAWIDRAAKFLGLFVYRIGKHHV